MSMEMNDRCGEVVLKAAGLSVGYDRRIVLQDLAFSLDRGSIVTLIGPNGAGKSTLLKTIIRQLEPKGGAVFLDGKNLFKMEEREIASTMSIVMTERVNPELLTCEDIVSYGRYPYTGRIGVLTERDREAVREAMAMTDIEELREVYFTELSDGQRQRVMLARAICQEPEIMILDEPLSFLDIRYKLEWLSILKKLVLEKGIAVLMTLHELDLALKISDRVICVKNGRIAFAGAPEEVLTKDRIEWLYDLADPAGTRAGIESDPGPEAEKAAGSGAEIDTDKALRGSFLPAFGSLELRRQTGIPAVFVIGGAGSGIPVYRQLWRQGICFAAGVLSRGDLDFPVAEALAQTVIASDPFEPVSETALQEASRVLAGCRAVICTIDPTHGFGTTNARNRELLELAEELDLPMEYRT